MKFLGTVANKTSKRGSPNMYSSEITKNEKEKKIFPVNFTLSSCD